MERDTSFFRNVFQVEVDFEGEPARVPIFYYDATAVTGIFYAKASVLRKFLPKKEFYPQTILPGVGAIAITCFEYRDTDIRPYNEISISIPMSYARRPWIPAWRMLSDMRRNEFHVYIHHLPVTTEIALAGGVQVYNYPKFMSEIDFDYTGDGVTVSLAEKGEMILRMRAKKMPAETEKVFRYVTYPVKDDCAQHADVLLHAKKFGQSYNPKYVGLELGKHSISDELREAVLWNMPVMYQYTPEFESILYGPSRLE